jgi:hypothetical protein
MTLIACTINHKVPFITADTLMSSKVGKEIVILPTNNFNINPFLPSDAKYKPDSLAQKLYIIKKNVCVAVAGSEYELIKFLKELEERCKLFDEVTESHIRDFFEEYDLNAQLPKSAFFLICIEHRDLESIYVGMFNYPKSIQVYGDSHVGGWKYLDNDVYDRVYACGSGAESFLNIVGQTGIFDTRHNKGGIWYAMQANISLIAKILAIERVTLHNLQTHWGGGFETVFYNGKEFEKISDLVYVICHGDFDQNGDIGLPFPSLFLYYTYKEDILHIIRVEVRKFRKDYYGEKIILTANAEDFTSNCFKVEKLGAMGDESQRSDDFSFKTFHVAIGYAILTPKNGVFNPSSYNVHPELTVAYVHNKSVEMILSRDVCESVRSSAKQVFDLKWK